MEDSAFERLEDCSRLRVVSWRRSSSDTRPWASPNSSGLSGTATWGISEVSPVPKAPSAAPPLWGLGPDDRVPSTSAKPAMQTTINPSSFVFCLRSIGLAFCAGWSKRGSIRVFHRDPAFFLAWDGEAAFPSDISELLSEAYFDAG